MRVDQLRLKGKEDKLAKRREQLSVCVASSVRRKSSKLMKQLSRKREGKKRMQQKYLHGAREKENTDAISSRHNVG